MPDKGLFLARLFQQDEGAGVKFSVFNFSFNFGVADRIAESVGGMGIAMVIDTHPGNEIALSVDFYREIAALAFHFEIALAAGGLHHRPIQQVAFS